MCGITGFIDFARSTPADRLDTVVTTMAAQMIHRGPDDAGTFVDAEAGVALGFRRLSIIDLTPAGHQPMVSSCGRWVIVFNGEIYNAEDLRPDLVAQGATFRGHSDTEVLLESIARNGIDTTLARINGMFAFAVHDRRTRTTILARDRLGKKPLYIGRFGRTVMFASELRCLRVHPEFRGEIRPEALSAYIRFGYVPHPLCIYRDVQQLEPGGVARVDAEGQLEVGSYWRFEDAAAEAMEEGFHGTDAEAIDQLDALLRDAVGRRMVSDVPLGAFLSGGIDSSLVVALMQQQSSRPVRTFSIGFAVDGYDEAPHARAVAKHLGTDHTEFYVAPQDALALVPSIPDIYDEPFSDSSQIPTFIVSKMARQHVTVALSGDGGDESFCGYVRYDQVEQLKRLMGVVPWLAPLAGFGKRVLTSRAFGPARRFIPGRTLSRGERWLTRTAEAGRPNAFERHYLHMIAQGRPPEEFLAAPQDRLADIWSGSLAARFRDPVQRAQAIDFMTYLPDDILVKVDRASMATSLEVRAPLIDYRVVEQAWRLPMHMKVRDGMGKWILRQVLYRYVPQSIIDRPKMGFGIPIDHWLRGPLREWAEDLIDAERLRREGVFNAPAVRAMWQRHLSGETWQYPIWCVLMFQAWRQRWP
ncbi:asparagine synthase (glutamine-hydrolyzing) [Rhodoplanes azumiensis]|uniref:asparagine synthase (glutamine-hydrolyzing) n=1 Tax=Rhodoplanes azumiensis TaxID=1897628 RepID=A0ABW5AJI7_9BRAD